jgi:hypothetical protein
MLGIFITGLVIGLIVCNIGFITESEGFTSEGMCNQCGSPPESCKCKRRHPDGECPVCKQPNMSNYVLKSSIPPCPVCPDMSNYILKSEIPPTPDLSNYVLKSSIPKQSPVILDCSKCNKSKGECPPCPRQKCPEKDCPQNSCPTCPKCPRPEPCPNPSMKVKCQAEESETQFPVRPYMSPLGFSGFGSM